MTSKEIEELYENLVSVCLENKERLRDDEGNCFVVEAAKMKNELKYYEKKLFKKCMRKV